MLIKKENRRDRFLRLKEKREDAIENELKKLGRLSVQSNYQYEQDEIDKLSFLLINLVKQTMALFGTNSTKERYERLLQMDVLEFQSIEKNDPQLFEYIKSNRPDMEALLKSIKDKSGSSQQDLKDTSIHNSIGKHSDIHLSKLKEFSDIQLSKLQKIDEDNERTFSILIEQNQILVRANEEIRYKLERVFEEFNLN